MNKLNYNFIIIDLLRWEGTDMKLINLVFGETKIKLWKWEVGSLK